MYTIEHCKNSKNFVVLSPKGSVVGTHNYKSEIEGSEKRAEGEAIDHCFKMNRAWNRRAA